MGLWVSKCMGKTIVHSNVRKDVVSRTLEERASSLSVEDMFGQGQY